MAVTISELETAKEILGRKVIGEADGRDIVLESLDDDFQAAVGTALLGLEEAMEHNASLSRQLDNMALFAANVCREVDYFRGGR